MSYQVIARKYRPKKFAEVVGQQAIVTILKNSLMQGRTAHAYLFCGSRGTGKTTLARLLAKSLNCDSKTIDNEPCNECSSCLAIAAGRSLDVLEIDGASNRGIDDIRQINETVAYASSAGKWKIYIIDEVHMLTKEAFNALLKTLEEPPVGVKFFFATTEPEKVPETIVSRCQRFDLNRISEEEILAKLKTICDDFGRTIELGALQLLALRSRGGLRDAESMLDQILCFTEGTIAADSVAKYLGLPTRHFFFQIDEHCAKENVPFALQLTEEIFEEGCDPVLFLEGLAEHYRLLLLLIYDPKQIEQRHFAWLEGEIKQTYLRSASLYTSEQCLFILEEIVNWLQKISKSPYPRLVIEILLTTILRSRQRISLDVLVHRLTLLEKDLLRSKSENSPKGLLHNPASSGKPGHFDEISNSSESAYTEHPIGDEAESKSCEMVIFNEEDQLRRSLLKEPSVQPAQMTNQIVQAIHEASVENPVLSTKPIESIEKPGIPSTHTTPSATKHDQPLQQEIKTQDGSVRHETIMRFAAVELEGAIKKPLT